MIRGVPRVRAAGGSARRRVSSSTPSHRTAPDWAGPIKQRSRIGPVNSCKPRRRRWARVARLVRRGGVHRRWCCRVDVGASAPSCRPRPGASADSGAGRPDRLAGRRSVVRPWRDLVERTAPLAERVAWAPVLARARPQGAADVDQAPGSRAPLAGPPRPAVCSSDGDYSALDERRVRSNPIASVCVLVGAQPPLGTVSVPGGVPRVTRGVRAPFCPLVARCAVAAFVVLQVVVLVLVRGRGLEHRLAEAASSPRPLRQTSRTHPRTEPTDATILLSLHRRGRPRHPVRRGLDGRG